jgi:hypothetical protein
VIDVDLETEARGKEAAKAIHTIQKSLQKAGLSGEDIGYLLMGAGMRYMLKSGLSTEEIFHELGSLVLVVRRAMDPSRDKLSRAEVGGDHNTSAQQRDEPS